MIFFSIQCFSQGFKIKDFKQNINDGSAFQAPLDAAGHPCGLVKVRSDNAELKFKGNIVGEVENKTNEYWIYLPQGCRSFFVIHPNYLPMSVDLSSYGVEIAPKATYILTLSEEKFKKEKCGLVATVKPETAWFYINDVFVENLSGNGFYQLYLPKGDYVCRMEQKGYRPKIQIVSVGKGTQNMNVELESVMAEIEVKCKTGTAEIYVDGELKGNGLWKGSIFAGEHQIEARQQNFESNSQTITIVEKESRTFVIPELKRSMGKISITTVPNNLPVKIDGESVGISPCTIEVESGKHYVLCSTFGCLPFRKDIEVDGAKTEIVQVEMEYTSSLFSIEEYKKAYTGNTDAIVSIIENVSEKSAKTPHMKEYGEETVFWLERLPNRNVYFDIIERREKQKNQNDPYIAKDLQNYLETVKLDKYFTLIKAYCNAEDADGAAELLDDYLTYRKSMGFLPIYIGEAFLKKKEYDKAIQSFEKAEKYGYEGLGDCYRAKGNKQLAASYYRKCLNLDYYDGKNRVEKKLKELGY